MRIRSGTRSILRASISELEREARQLTPWICFVGDAWQQVATEGYYHTVNQQFILTNMPGSRWRWTSILSCYESVVHSDHDAWQQMAKEVQCGTTAS